MNIGISTPLQRDSNAENEAIFLLLTPVYLYKERQMLWKNTLEQLLLIKVNSTFKIQGINIYINKTLS
jgi:hypothetical protein